MESIGKIGVLVKTKLPIHGWAGRPARAANRGGGQRGVAVAYTAPCPKKTAGLVDRSVPQTGSGDSGALRLRTLTLGQKVGTVS